MQVAIAASLLDRLLAEAAADPTREICGLLFGDVGQIGTAQRVANVAVDDRRAFEIDPKELFSALREERRGGPRLIGHYHSHPNGSAEPSQRDLAASEPGKLWLILGGGEASLWLAVQGAFREAQMIVN